MFLPTEWRTCDRSGGRHPGRAAQAGCAPLGLKSGSSV